MKKIAILVPGGVGNFKSGMHIPAIANLVSTLSREHELTVFSLSRPGWREKNERCADAEVEYVDAHREHSSLVRTARQIKAVRARQAEKGFQLLHGFWGTPCGLAAVILGRLLHIPSIVTFQGGETASIPYLRYGGMRNLRSRWTMQWICRNATSLTCLTDFQVRELNSHGIRRSGVSVIPHGVDTHRFAPDGVAGVEIPLRLLHVGNLTEVKDQATLLRAFQVLRRSIGARLRIVGPDFLKGALHRLAEVLGVHDGVEFLGFVDPEELPLHYRWAHFVLLTSLHEAQSVVVSEALASGTVVAGTRVGLVADLDGRCTVASPVGDAETLAESVLRLVNDPVRYAGLRTAGLEWSRRYDLAWTARQYADLYEAVTSPGGPAASSPRR